MVWRKRTDLKLMVSTPLNSSAIVIRENSFLGGRNYHLEVLFTSADGLSGMSAYNFSTSSPPSGGVCTIDPTLGISLGTNFTLSCSSWKSDSEPLSYLFQYQLSNGLNSVIYHGLNNSVTVKLPYGVLNFSASVTDKNGASASVMNLTVKVSCKLSSAHAYWVRRLSVRFRLSFCMTRVNQEPINRSVQLHTASISKLILDVPNSFKVLIPKIAQTLLKISEGYRRLLKHF